MLTAAEIARGLQGALGFLQRDPAAPRYFENTLEACLRSFRVMGLLAPLYLLYLVVYYANVTTMSDELEILFVESVRYVVDWLLYPVLFYEAAKRQGWLDRYARYIGALNWINLPALVIALISLAIASVSPTAIAVLIDLGIRALFFYWFLVTTRMIVGTSWPMSIMLLIVNWVPSFLLSLLVARILGVAVAGPG